MLDTLRGGTAFCQAEFKVILYCCEEIPETFSSSVQKTLQQRLLVRLQAAGDAVLIDAAAAVRETARTNESPAAQRVHVAATVYHQVLPLTHVTQFIGEQRLALDRVPAL